MSLYHLSATDRVADIIGAIKLMAPSDLERERGLAHCKWFAYRFMSPLAATKHFAELYRQGVQRYARYHQDIDLAGSVRGLSPNVFLKPSGSLTELWRARQRADELGLPYELLIDFAFEFAGRRKWRHTPRPMQLFGSKKSGVAWQAEFEKYLSEHLLPALDRLSGLPQYRVENHRGLPVQDEFRAALLEQIMEMKKPWSTAIGKHCVETRHLPVLRMMRLVPPELRHGVISEIRRDLSIEILHPASVERLPLIAYVPGCFGLPHAHDPRSSECSTCPLREKCEALTLDVTHRMHDRYGSLSPLQDARDRQRREKTRIRVARHRLKKSDPDALAATTS